MFPTMSPETGEWKSNRHARWTLLATAGLLLCVGVTYWNSLEAPFIFDDIGSIVGNPTIEHFSTSLVAPPLANGAVGRPLVNFTLALNYALGGRNVRGYHIFNLSLHLGVGLLLFGVLRRTFLSAPLRQNLGAAAIPLAFIVTALWLLHPVQTESVICVIQRSELLVSFFYVLTLYAVIRDAELMKSIPDGRSPPTFTHGWFVLAVVSCFLGVMSKEVIVTAPLVILLYDRTFLAGTFRETWRQRGRLYLALASSWLLLAWLVHHGDKRAGVAGFGLGLSPWNYLLTQCNAIMLYLRLAFWPNPLLLDYGRTVVGGLEAVWPKALLLVSLAGLTGWATGRKPRWGFVGIWFFGLLAPSSSVVPLPTQTIAEHRLYLPLLALIVPSVLGIYRTLGLRRMAWVLVPVAALMIFTTTRRTLDYRTALTIWTDVVERRPDNPRGHQNRGVALDAEGRTSEAIAEYETALRLNPLYSDAHLNLANALQQNGRSDEAASHYEAALRGIPDLPDAHYNLGNIFAGQQRYPEAIAHYTEALRLHPDYASAHHNLGNVWLITRHPAEAAAEFEAARRLEPDNASTCANLGFALALVGRTVEAEQPLKRALQLEPDNALARETLAHLQQNSPAR